MHVGALFFIKNSKVYKRCCIELQLVFTHPVEFDLAADRTRFIISIKHAGCRYDL